MRRLLLALVLTVSSAAAWADKTAGETVDDTWIHTKVKSALVGHGTSNINIEVYHGVVQLAGFVDSETHRTAAGQAAAGVKGVVAVHNRLVVQTASRSAGQVIDDGVMAGNVKRALSSDPRTSAFGINVEVRNGVVLLSGFVNDHGEAQAAEQVARAVKHVQDVINGMDVPADKS